LFFKKFTKCEYAKKSHVALIFLTFGKNYPNCRKLAQKKKTVPNTKICVQMWQSIFSYQKQMHFSKKLQFFSLRKGNLWRKILFYFFESSNSQFWGNPAWNKLVRFWVGWIIYLFIFLIWWHPTEKIINFSIHYIYVCVCVSMAYWNLMQTINIDELELCITTHYQWWWWSPTQKGRWKQDKITRYNETRGKKK
jgi:hypothetical protein